MKQRSCYHHFANCTLCTFKVLLVLFVPFCSTRAKITLVENATQYISLLWDEKQNSGFLSFTCRDETSKDFPLKSKGQHRQGLVNKDWEEKLAPECRSSSSCATFMRFWGGFFFKIILSKFLCIYLMYVCLAYTCCSSARTIWSSIGEMLLSILSGYQEPQNVKDKGVFTCYLHRHRRPALKGMPSPSLLPCPFAHMKSDASAGIPACM